MRSHALLLAAGAGRRMGTPKALVTGADGQPWVVRAISALDGGGCDRVSVVVGAGADRVEPLVSGSGARPVLAEDWAQGMGASLATGLAAVSAEDPHAELLVLMLVDLPDVGAEVIARVLAEARSRGAAALVRAAYGGNPGHPVVIGRDHWADLAAGLGGDRGARDWLAGRPVDLVECSDLAGGEDVDDPATLADRNARGKHDDGPR
ncbi:nucleotidyltransferase family protein [Propionibacteriaceae bacterium Y1923]